MLSQFPIFSDAFITAIGWTIVHSIWQLALISSLYFLFDKWSSKNKASLRYMIGVLSLGLMLLCTVATFMWCFEYEQPLTEESSISSSIIYSFAATDTADTITFSAPHFRSILESYFPLLTNIWIVGVGLLFLRLMWNYGYIWRLRRFGKIAVTENWQERFEKLKIRIRHARMVQLFESSLVTVPLTIGHLKPLILLPVGTINRLTIEEVEAILIHELAHIARHDFLVNILQSFIEILLFYHPAVWWLSAQIRREREHCCDDRTLAAGVNRVTYAKALYRLQKQTNTATLALSFAARNQQLLHRIQRLLGQPTTAVSSTQSRWWLTVSLIAILMIGSVKGDTSETQLIADGTEFMTAIEPIIFQDNKVLTDEKEKVISTNTVDKIELQLTHNAYDTPTYIMPQPILEELPTTDLSDWEESFEILDTIVSSPRLKATQPDFMRELRQQLLKDRLIDDLENYTLEWTHKRFKVNGQIQSIALQTRYQQLIEKHTAAPLTKKDKVKINVHPQLQEIHFDFKEGGGMFRNESPLPSRLLEQLYTTEEVVAEADDDDLMTLGRSKVIKKIDRELRKDGLLDKRGTYTFELNARTRQLLINGVAKPIHWQRKYEQLLRTSTTYDLSWDFVFEYTKNDLFIQQNALSNYGENPHRSYSDFPRNKTDYIFNNVKLLSQLTRALQKDQLLQNTKSYTFKIDDNRLSINDITQDDKWQWKYEQFIREQASVPLADGFHFTLEHNIDGETNFILTDN